MPPRQVEVVQGKAREPQRLDGLAILGELLKEKTLGFFFRAGLNVSRDGRARWMARMDGNAECRHGGV